MGFEEVANRADGSTEEAFKTSSPVCLWPFVGRRLVYCNDTKRCHDSLTVAQTCAIICIQD